MGLPPCVAAKTRLTVTVSPNSLRLQAIVIRNGELNEVESAELVPGDIIQVRVGDRVPADARVLRLEAGKFENDIATCL